MRPSGAVVATVALTFLLVASQVVGCCGTPLATRQKSAADLRASAQDVAATWDVIRKHMVPAPTLTDAERVALATALQNHGAACAEVAEHADALAAAEGAEAPK